MESEQQDSSGSSPAPKVYGRSKRYPTVSVPGIHFTQTVDVRAIMSTSIAFLIAYDSATYKKRILHPFNLDNIPSFLTPQPLYMDGGFIPEGSASFHDILVTHFDNQDAVAMHLFHSRITWSNEVQLATAYKNVEELTKSKDLPFTFKIVTFNTGNFPENGLLEVRSRPINPEKDRPVMIGDIALGFNWTYEQSELPLPILTLRPRADEFQELGASVWKVVVVFFLGLFARVGFGAD